MDIIVIGLFAIVIAWFWYLYTLSRPNPSIRELVSDTVETATTPPTLDVITETPAVAVVTEPEVKKKKVAAAKAPVKAKAKPTEKAPAKRQYNKKPKV